MQGIAVGGGIDGDRFNAKFATRSHDTQSNFAAISDKDFLEHLGL
jgi:hypothetical protein